MAQHWDPVQDEVRHEPIEGLLLHSSSYQLAHEFGLVPTLTQNRSWSAHQALWMWCLSRTKELLKTSSAMQAACVRPWKGIMTFSTPHAIKASMTVNITAAIMNLKYESKKYKFIRTTLICGQIWHHHGQSQVANHLADIIVVVQCRSMSLWQSWNLSIVSLCIALVPLSWVYWVVWVW